MNIYLDSCIVIYVIERHPAYSALIRALMQSTNAAFCFSSLVRLECLVLPLRNNDTGLFNRYDAFFNQARRLDLTPAVYESAARLRAAHRGLKTPDALHLATALHHGCTEFWTNDDRLATVEPNLARKVT